VHALNLLGCTRTLSYSVRSRRVGRKALHAPELHAAKSTNEFGFGCATYCGPTRVENGWFDTWEECFSVRVGGVLDILENGGEYEDLCKMGREILGPVARKYNGGEGCIVHI